MEETMFMKKRIRFVLGIMCMVLFTTCMMLSHPIKFATASELEPAMELAPINPEFLNYLKIHPSNGLGDHGPLNQRLGSIPSPLLLPNQQNVVKTPLLLSKSLTSALPTSYDLRTKDKLTAVRDQGSSGSCWAFAAMGSLESTLMPKEKLDFSENNLKNNSGYDLHPNTGGGMPLMSMAYFARWGGPVSEADDHYDPSSIVSPNKPPQKHVQEALSFGYKDMSYSDIKNMVLKYGAVETRIFWNDVYFNPANNSYFYPGTSNINHEVAIVGWNDDYPKENFTNQPLTNGAFIVRNSWGPNWGDKGYFYVSYWDYNIGVSNTVFNNAESTNNYKTIYQYDPLGRLGSLNVQSDTAWMANVFTATSTEPLSAISFYTPVPKSSYEVRVYNKFTGTFNEQVPVTTGTIEMAGYHTISLGKTIPVETGKKFAVSVKLITPNTELPIALEFKIPGLSSKANALPGQSYASLDGNDWTDLTSIDSSANVCLKVFTVKDPGPMTKLEAVPPSLNVMVGKTEAITLNATYKDSSPVDVSGLATWTPSKPAIATVKVEDGKATIEGKTVGITTVIGEYGGKKVTINVKVTPEIDHLLVQPSNLAIDIGKTQVVKIFAIYKGGTQEDVSKLVKLESDKPSVATVSGTSVTGGLSRGETTVRGSYNGILIEIPVKVNAALKNLVFTPPGLNLTAGKSEVVTLKATYADGFSEDVTGLATLAPSKPNNIVSVTVEGGKATIKGLTMGTATINGSYGGKKAALNVTVTPVLDHLAAQPSNVAVTIGKTQALKIYAVYVGGTQVEVSKSVMLVSDEPSVATVSGTTVKGLKIGDTTVRGSYKDMLIEIPVKVTEKLKSLAIAPASPSLDLLMGQSKSATLTATYTDGSTEDVSGSANWTLSKPTVASVTVNGGTVTIKGKAAGTTTVTGTFGTLSKKININVMAMTLQSSAFKPNQKIPLNYANTVVKNGKNLSVPLAWTYAPQDTRSFSLIMYDMDYANTAHWAVSNIPANVSSISEGASNTAMPFGSAELENGFAEIGYTGPFPPLNKTHKYKFVLYALDIDNIDPNSTITDLDDLLQLIDGHVLAKGELIGSFKTQA